MALSELTPSGYHVLTVNATDADIGDNARIVYSMGVAPVQGFVIDPTTGECINPEPGTKRMRI